MRTKININNLNKYAELFKKCKLHINQKIIDEGNELADIVILKFKDLKNKYDSKEQEYPSFKFKDLDVFLRIGPFHASYGSKKIYLSFSEKTTDGFIRQTVIHEYTHNVQYDKAIDWTIFYHRIEDIAENNYAVDDGMLEDAVLMSKFLKQIFPQEASFQNLVDEMIVSSESKNVKKTQELAKQIHYIVHHNSPHELEAIRHEMYQSFKDHLSDENKIKYNVDKFNIKNIRDYMRILIKYVGHIFLSGLFESNHKKLLIALWGLMQEYKQVFYKLGLTD
jgi:hypothetical protein